MKLPEKLLSLRGHQSREQFGKKVGVNPKTLYNYETGHTEPTAAAIVRICLALDITPNNLLDFPFDKDGLSDEFVVIPKYDVSKFAGLGSNLFDEPSFVDGGQAFRKDYLEKFGLQANMCSVTVAAGDSMATTINDGDCILVDHTPISNPKDGVYMFQYSGSLFIKRLQFVGAHDIRIISDNPRYETTNMNGQSGSPDFKILGVPHTRSGRII